MVLHSDTGFLEELNTGFMLMFTGVYGPCDSKKRRELWHKLGAIRGLEALPWVWGGIDFNVTRFSDKRSGRDNNTKSMFLNLVSNVGYARRC
uniref:Uncharacterized protein n=1 Tax=Solanum tuberosum TaxID=4113 RepID=M1C623_SOLTU